MGLFLRETLEFLQRIIRLNSILEIRKVGRTAEAYLLMKKKPRKFENIKKDLKEYDDLRSKNKKRKPFAIYL